MPSAQVVSIVVTETCGCTGDAPSIARGFRSVECSDASSRKRLNASAIRYRGAVAARSTLSVGRNVAGRCPVRNIDGSCLTAKRLGTSCVPPTSVRGTGGGSYG